MPRPDHFDDAAIDALLAGSARGEGDAGLTSFIEELRATAGAVPIPTPALAAAIAAGGISTHQPPVAKWRKWHMKIKGLVAGLGVAGKLALGVGVAAAATTGAGAAGVLPGPVQHAMSNAVSAVSPFSLPDPDHHGANDGNLAGGGESTTTTTVADVTTTIAPGPHDGKGDSTGANPANGDGTGVVTPTTIGEHHGSGDATTTTTVGEITPPPTVPDSHDGNGSGDGNGTTPTTVHHGDGDSNNPQSLTLHCERSADPVRISCAWSAATNPDHARYVLLRTGDGHGRVLLQSEDALSFTDTSVTPGVTYTYLVDSLRADGSVSSHSNRPVVECCGATTTTTTEHHDGTTTTTVHH
ncbi:MAG TPA: hypothetical protein VGP92_00865 [Acidimicrobiia bacterium]|nr:hypothetical protein [Acidimicrobiia bacterium]